MEWQNREEVPGFFAKASSISNELSIQYKPQYKTEWEWQKAHINLDERRRLDGVKKFKRRVLGFCGTQSVKTFDQLDGVLQSLHLSTTRSESEQIIGELTETRLYIDPHNYLTFSEVRDARGNPFYRITKELDLTFTPEEEANRNDSMWNTLD